MSHFEYIVRLYLPFFFFFNAPATTEIYTLSLHDALPICIPLVNLPGCEIRSVLLGRMVEWNSGTLQFRIRDRKSTRLNSSHGYISYAVFCLKKKKKMYRTIKRHNVDCNEINACCYSTRIW